MQKTKLAQVIALQNQLNQQVAPDWAQRNFAWDTAILVETAELIDSFAWKWWKAGTSDLANAKVEVVDIFHFLISAVLATAHPTDAGETVEQVAHQCFEAALDQQRSYSAPDAVLDVDAYIYGVKQFIRAVSSAYLTSNPQDDITESLLRYKADAEALGAGLVRNSILRRLCFSFVHHLVTPMFASADELLNMYLAKNMLNRLRQARGYKSGAYVKMWGAEEDNAVVMRLVAQNIDGVENVDEIYCLIDAYYVEWVLVSGDDTAKNI